MPIEFPPLPPTSVTATLHDWRVACGRIQSESLATPRWENLHHDPIRHVLVWRTSGRAVTPETIDALQMMYRLGDHREPVAAGDVLVFAAGIAPPTWEASIPLPRNYPIVLVTDVLRRAAAFGIDPTDAFVGKIRDQLGAASRVPIPNPAWRPSGSAPEHISELTWFDPIPRMLDDHRDFLRIIVTRAAMDERGTYTVGALRATTKRILQLRKTIPPSDVAKYNDIARAAVENRALIIPQLWSAA